MATRTPAELCELILEAHERSIIILDTVKEDLEEASKTFKRLEKAFAEQAEQLRRLSNGVQGGGIRTAKGTREGKAPDGRGGFGVGGSETR